MNKIQEAEEQFEKAKRALKSNKETLKIPAGDWRLKTRWLDDNYKSDVSTLHEWIEYAASTKGNSASISKYYSLDTSNFERIDFKLEYLNAGRSFTPFFDCLYRDDFQMETDGIPLIFSGGSIPPSALQITTALLTKPFAILTGASGTGKTKLAETLAMYLTNPDGSNSELVAVGADWTDNRNVLGFVNHLRTDEESKHPTYQTTPVLELLLRANGDPNTPYFLILDEMNLSHVERYFADFLSVMEQKDGRFQLHSEGPGDDGFTLPVSGNRAEGVPRTLPYPENLFVIGTVNIDETTYMFSPKVLDRANVIEFKVKDTEFDSFLKNPAEYPEIEPAQPGVAEGFLELAKKTRRDGGLDPVHGETLKDVRSHLMAFFGMMQEHRFEFAYRTGNEIIRYLRVCQHLADNRDGWQKGGWKKDLDTQVLQKILPKLHGSIGRIAPLICALSHYCETGQTHKVPKLRDFLAKTVDKEKDKALFPRSLGKLREMAKTLSVEQFVSFIS